MQRRTILVTGGSDGIGAASVRTLVRHGHRVLVTGRSPEKTQRLAAETGASAFVADFADLADVRRLAAEVSAELGPPDGADPGATGGLDVLANNAGGIFGTDEPTVDGFEQTFQVNHLAPFLLTHLLLPHLLRARGSVVTTSSVAHRLFGRLDPATVERPGLHGANRTYGDSKLANVLFTRGLHARYAGQGLSAVAFHPGTVATSFASQTSSLMRVVYRTPLRRLLLVDAEAGGSTLTWFVEGVPGETWMPGAYYDLRRRTDRVNPQVRDDAMVDALWDRSAALVGIA